jgi:hypothetical protein
MGTKDPELTFSSRAQRPELHSWTHAPLSLSRDPRALTWAPPCTILFLSIYPLLVRLSYPSLHQFTSHHHPSFSLLSCLSRNHITISESIPSENLTYSYAKPIATWRWWPRQAPISDPAQSSRLLHGISVPSPHVIITRSVPGGHFRGASARSSGPSAPRLQESPWGRETPPWEDQIASR